MTRDKNKTRKTLGLILPICLLFSSNGLALNSYSTQELDELEKEFIQQINQSNSVERNPLANQYINQLGKQLADAANLPKPLFFVVKSNEINAFAGPGGYIGINSQLILATENESELAAVMAHELAHVRLHHLYQLVQHEKQMRIPMIAALLAAAALGMLNPALGSGAMMASLTGFSQDNINFVRLNEKQADRIGIAMLMRAGFDPRGMPGFFKKMQQTSRYYYTANIPAILRTHPLDDDRIAEAENRIGHQSNAHKDSTDYHLFKELIRTSVNQDSKQLLDYYQHSCSRHNPETACQYGRVLTLINLNQYKHAETSLEPLLAHDKTSLFYQIAMAQAETGNKSFSIALKRLLDLRNTYPKNYAALMAYAQGLLAAGEVEKASDVLLKGSRVFKRDLPLCEELARAQSVSGHKAYAYFTKSKCYLLQGRHPDALRQLQRVASLAKKDPYMLARANAMIEELKYLAKKD